MRKNSDRGYILIETTVAMVVLGISAITIHSVIRQSIQTRGQVQDFTHVRFLMEDYLARIELQPYVFEGEVSGVFDEGDGRFSYRHEIREVEVPVPPTPQPRNVPAEEVKPFKHLKTAECMIHLSLTVRWSRGGMDFVETMETLLPQKKLWDPKKDEEGYGDAL